MGAQVSDRLQGPDVLDEAVALMESAPQSAPALTMYALVSTLEHPKSGCLFRLSKLADLSAQERAIAYGLMDLLAVGAVGSDRWVATKERMDALVRGADGSR
jgi:hypothetical protein